MNHVAFAANVIDGPFVALVVYSYFSPGANNLCHYTIPMRLPGNQQDFSGFINLLCALPGHKNGFKNKTAFQTS